MEMGATEAAGFSRYHQGTDDADTVTNPNRKMRYPVGEQFAGELGIRHDRVREHCQRRTCLPDEPSGRCFRVCPAYGACHGLGVRAADIGLDVARPEITDTDGATTAAVYVPYARGCQQCGGGHGRTTRAVYGHDGLPTSLSGSGAGAQ